MEATVHTSVQAQDREGEREREAYESSKKQSSVRRPLKEKESLSPSLITLTTHGGEKTKRLLTFSSLLLPSWWKKLSIGDIGFGKKLGKKTILYAKYTVQESVLSNEKLKKLDLSSFFCPELKHNCLKRSDATVFDPVQPLIDWPRNIPKSLRSYTHSLF